MNPLRQKRGLTPMAFARSDRRQCVETLLDKGFHADSVAIAIYKSRALPATTENQPASAQVLFPHGTTYPASR